MIKKVILTIISASLVLMTGIGAEAQLAPKSAPPAMPRMCPYNIKTQHPPGGTEEIRRLARALLSGAGCSGVTIKDYIPARGYSSSIALPYPLPCRQGKA